MTYCIGMQLDSGLIFLSDSRTSAGVDQVNIFRKVNTFVREGDRVLVLLSAGNLAITQALGERVAGAHVDSRCGQFVNCAKWI